MRLRHGWIYREPAVGVTPARIRVKLNQNLHPEQKKERVFDDNNNGAQQAADYISEVVGDSWKLEDLAFLGCRIFTES